MGQGGRIDRGKVLPFAGAGSRSRRAADPETSPERGTLLLWTGVRYERPAVAPPPRAERADATAPLAG